MEGSAAIHWHPTSVPRRLSAIYLLNVMEGYGEA